MDSKFEHIEENGIKYLVHPKDSIFAGMYMYSEKNKDYFKNYYTRGYRSYPQFGIKEKIKNRFKER